MVVVAVVLAVALVVAIVVVSQVRQRRHGGPHLRKARRELQQHVAEPIVDVILLARPDASGGAAKLLGTVAAATAAAAVGIQTDFEFTSRHLALVTTVGQVYLIPAQTTRKGMAPTGPPLLIVSRREVRLTTAPSGRWSQRVMIATADGAGGEFVTGRDHYTTRVLAGLAHG